MKKIVLALSLILITSPAHAWFHHGHHGSVTNVTNNYTTTNVTNTTEENNKDIYGVKLDAPKLIRISTNWYFGVEDAKDLYLTNMDEGYTIYGKLTYYGTWIDFTKKSKPNTQYQSTNEGCRDIKTGQFVKKGKCT